MASTTEVISRWSTLIENFNYSPQQFYEALAAAVAKRQIPDARMEKIQMKEGGIFSAKREYLGISCKKDFYFAICAAPFGTGFFVSWWLLDPPDGFFSSVFSTTAAIAKAFVKPWTYYRVDAATMFQTATHTAVLEVIDSITTSQGLKALTEAERKPIMREFFGS
jgi:hypothetical protein